MGLTMFFFLGNPDFMSITPSYSHQTKIAKQSMGIAQAKDLKKEIENRNSSHYIIEVLVSSSHFSVFLRPFRQFVHN